MTHTMKKIFDSAVLTALFTFIFSLFTCHASAQCPLPNTAFQAGEKLQYELYFNWKFVWVKAGTATFSTTSVDYQGQKAFKTHLITRTSAKLDKFFCMRDTLTATITPDNVPLVYRKGAYEGKKYRVDEVAYSYPEGKTHLKQTYRNPEGKITRGQRDLKDCVYDMISMMQRARSFKISQFEKSNRMQFWLADGDEVDNVFLVYRGKETVKQEHTDVKFRCLVFSFIEKEKGKEKEIVRFFVSDDDNHIPVRLDLFLKFGSAKAYLSSYSGLRNPVSSIVKK